MSKDKSTTAAPASAPSTDAPVTMQNGSSPTIREGFFYGFIGAAVRDGKGGPVIDYTFRASKTVDGKEKLIAEFARVEAPYPDTDEAALAMAADCKTTVYRAGANGSIEAVKLTGIRAAVSIARDGRPVETLRSKVRTEEVSGEDQVRRAAAGLFNFTGIDTDVVVERDSLAAIFADETLTPEERQAKVVALMLSAGVNVK